MKYGDIAKELARYKPGMVRLLGKTESHVGPLQKFYVGKDKESLRDEDISANNLLDLAKIILGKGDRESNKESSKLFRRLAAYFGGYSALDDLKKANLLLIPILEPLTRYVSQIRQEINTEGLTEDKADEKVYNELEKQTSTIIIPLTVAVANKAITVRCATEMMTLFRNQPNSVEHTHVAGLLAKMIAKFRTIKNESDYIAVLDDLRESGCKLPLVIDKVLAVEDIELLRKVISRIKMIPNVSLTPIVDQILEIKSLKIFFELLLSIPTGKDSFDRFFNSFESLSQAMVLFDATKNHCKIGMNSEFSEQEIKSVIDTLKRNRDYSLEIAKAIDLLCRNKKIDKPRLELILSEPKYAVQRAKAIDQLEKEAKVNDSALQLIEKAGEQTQGVAEFYIQFCKMKTRPNILDNLIKKVAEKPQYASTTARVLKPLIAKNFEGYQPNIDYIASHLDTMPVLAIEVERLVSAGEDSFTQKSFSDLTKTQATKSEATPAVVNPARVRGTAFNGKGNKEKTPGTTQLIEEKITAAMTNLATSSL